jgi:hypothetical protein
MLPGASLTPVESKQITLGTQAKVFLAGSSLGLKASVGYWRHDTRLEYHRDAATLQEKTAEGNTVKTLSTKKRLVIPAADKLLTTHGPGMSPCI